MDRQKGMLVLLLLLVFLTSDLFAADGLWNEAMQNHGAVMLLIETETGRIVRANHAASGFYGYPVEELQTMNIAEISVLSAEEVETERLAAAVEARNYFVFPHRLRNGETRTVEVYSYPIDSEGSLLYSTIYDITDRITAENALLDNARRFVQAEELTNSGHWEFHLSENRVVVSDGAKDLFGWEGDEWTLEDARSIVLPEYWAERDSALQDLIEANVPYDVHFQVRREPDGRIIDIHSVAEYDPVRNVVFGSLVDVTAHNKALRDQRVQRNWVIVVITIALIFSLFVTVVLSRMLRLRKAAEQDARMRERDLQVTLRSIGDGVIATDKKGNVTNMNPVAEQLTGWSLDEALGQPLNIVFKIINAQSRSPVENPVAEVIESGTIVGLANHTILVAKDGAEYQIADSAAPITDEMGNIVGVVLVFRDVTDEYEAQKSIVTSERRYRQLFESSAAGIAVHEVITGETGQPVDYRFVDLNHRFELMTGLQKQDILGKTVLEVLPQTEEYWIQRYGNVALTGEPDQFEAFSGEMGRHYSVYSFCPTKNHFVTMFFDITKQKELELELSLSHKQLQSTLDALNKNICVLDQAGTIISVNERWWRFAVKNEASLESVGLGINYLNVCSATQGTDRETALRFAEAIKAVVTGALDHYELEYECSSQNEERWFIARINPLSDIKDGPRRVVISHEDMTDRKLAAKRLKQSEEKFRTLFETMGQGVVYQGTDGRILLANPAAERILRRTNRELSEMRIEDWRCVRADGSVFSVEEYPAILALQTGEKVEGIVMGLTVSSEEQYRWIRVDSIPQFKDDGGVPYQVYSTIEDITERKMAEDKLTFITYHDTVTGLHNRAYFEAQLERLDKSGTLPLCIIMADVNGLKVVNDALGHQEGDRLLRKAASILKKSCHSQDLVARWGGDEFTMVLESCDEERVKAVISNIEGECQKGDLRDPLTLSMAVGYAIRTNPDKSMGEVLRQAEDNMYRHKMVTAKSSRNAIVASLQSALQEKSHETEEHCRNIEKISTSLGKEIGLSDAELTDLSLLALLHDIGKVAIPESILNKTGPLSEEEWEIMKTHTQIGYRIAASTPDLVGIAEYVLSHHERWDGKGYPRGLKGEDIPILSRILFLADTFDAITSDRVYRRAASVKDALIEIKANAGSQFDPHLTEAFIRMIENMQ